MIIYLFIFLQDIPGQLRLMIKGSELLEIFLTIQHNNLERFYIIHINRKRQLASLIKEPLNKFIQQIFMNLLISIEDVDEK
jgi:hypothetical protein